MPDDFIAFMGDSDLEELYQAVILDHYKNPRCQGSCSDCNGYSEAFNPLCGDVVKLSILNDSEKITKIRFEGKGCAISQATASLMAELCEGQTVSKVRELKQIYEEMILNDKSESDIDVLGDSALLRGIKKFPARYRCALLAWQGLEEAINDSFVVVQT